MASTQSPLGVLSIVNGYPNRQHSRPSGRACCFVFGYRFGTGLPPWGPPPHLGPAVHSIGRTALHHAARRGNRRIVRSLVASGADVNSQNDFGCAVCACGESAECAGRVAACRQTPLHSAAAYGHSNNIAELLLRGADGAVQDNFCDRRRW
jgi:hypothetical protein